MVGCGFIATGIAIMLKRILLTALEHVKHLVVQAILRFGRTYIYTHPHFYYCRNHINMCSV